MNIAKGLWILGMLAVLAVGGFCTVRLRCAYRSTRTVDMPYEFLKYQAYSAFLESTRSLGEQHFLIRNKSNGGGEPIVARFSTTIPYRLISESDSAAACEPDIDAIIDFSPVTFRDNHKMASFEASIMNGRCLYDGIIKKVTVRNVCGEWKVVEASDIAGFATSDVGQDMK
jgi:hypothetical protein